MQVSGNDECLTVGELDAWIASESMLPKLF